MASIKKSSEYVRLFVFSSPLSPIVNFGLYSVLTVFNPKDSLRALSSILPLLPPFLPFSFSPFFYASVSFSFASSWEPFPVENACSWGSPSCCIQRAPSTEKSDSPSSSGSPINRTDSRSLFLSPLLIWPDQYPPSSIPDLQTHPPLLDSRPASRFRSPGNTFFRATGSRPLSP